MDRGLVKKWVRALESGKYRQTTGGLCKVDKHQRYSYCCLGVAARVCGEKHIRGGYLGSDSGSYPGVARKMGLTSTREHTLAYMNDNQRANFKEIAKWIRNNILKENA